MKKLVQLAVVTLLLVTACSKHPQTDKALNYANNLTSDMDNFDKARQKTADALSKTTEKIKDLANKKDVPVSDLSKEWETEMGGIRKNFADLQRKFMAVSESSKEYFQKLDKYTSAIKDDKAKTKELAINEDLRAKYMETFNTAQAQMEEINNILQAGDDVQQMAMISSMRSEIGKNIDELKHISETASEMLTKLHSFTVEGKKLISPTSAPSSAS